MATFTLACDKAARGKPHGPHSEPKVRRNRFGRVVGQDTYRCTGVRDFSGRGQRAGRW